MSGKVRVTSPRLRAQIATSSLPPDREYMAAGEWVAVMKPM